MGVGAERDILAAKLPVPFDIAKRRHGVAQGAVQPGGVDLNRASVLRCKAQNLLDLVVVAAQVDADFMLAGDVAQRIGQMPDNVELIKLCGLDQICKIFLQQAVDIAAAPRAEIAVLDILTGQCVVL